MSGIPLNIDWQQILLHLFNFVILSGGLYFLLYKPVKDFMDKRVTYYQQMDTEAEEKLEQAKKMEASWEERISSADAEIAQKKAAAMRAAEIAAAEQLQSAKKESEEILSKAYASARQERQRIVDDAGRKIAELAAATTEQLTRKAYGSAYNLFLDTVEAEGGVFDDEEEES